MHVLFLGDVVGRAGRRVILDSLPKLIEEQKIDFVVVNVENSAGGFGVTEKICRKILDAGADVLTSGNHIWDQPEALVFIERQSALLRPLNYPKGTPGRGVHLYRTRAGAHVLVINAMGRVFMETLDDPFAAIQNALADCPLGQNADAVIIDLHAEATSEKQAFAQMFDGMVSLVVGTHTHVPTADYQILDKGTGYISDVGMCGDYNSVLGMDKEEAISRFVTKIRRRPFQAREGPATLCGIAALLDPATGLTQKIEPVRLGGRLASYIPSFWQGISTKVLKEDALW